MIEKRICGKPRISRRGFLAGAASTPVLGISSSFGQAPPVWAEWKDLLNLLPDAAALGAKRKAAGLPEVKFTVQKIEDASATKINFDRYAVNVTRLPSKYTAAKLFEFMRKNLNDFFDRNYSTVAGITDKDSTKWSGPGEAPLGSIMLFKIPVVGPAGEEAAVITSVSASNRWIFTPVKIGLVCPGEHPVSGNREFGYRDVGGGIYQFYTRAADRATGICLGMGENTIYEGADNLWKSWQSKLVSFVAANNGSAKALERVFHQPNWVEVKKSDLFSRAG
jgi:hypothetical protein